MMGSGKINQGSRAITLELKREIESGKFRDGEQLPPERDLALSYSSSRSTIRKALFDLEEIGMVVRKMGSGTFVRHTESDANEVQDVVDIISPIHLIDARVGFERQMARLAAIHATNKDLERMESALRNLEASEEDKESFTQHDSIFHLLIAKATRNPLIIHLYEQINEVRTHEQWKKMKNVILTPAQIRKYNVFHREIFNALGNRDAARAIQALNGHMEMAKQDLLGAEDQL